VVDVMANYDCVVFPSLWPETFSMVFSEAVVAGCKIVAPSIGAFKERVVEAGGNAFLYKLGDPLSFSVAVNAALSTAYSPLDEHAGENLTIDAMAQSYIRIADEAASRLGTRSAEEAVSAPTVMAHEPSQLPAAALDGNAGEGDDDDEGLMLVGGDDLDLDQGAFSGGLSFADAELAPEPAPVSIAAPRPKARSWQPAGAGSADAANPFADPRSAGDAAPLTDIAEPARRARKRAEASDDGAAPKRRPGISRP